MIRIFDIIIAIIFLIVLAPTILVIALLIKFSSAGPILFKQIRIGKNGQEFTLYKFRTMLVGSHKLGLLTIGEKDSRLTSIGTFLKKLKLDEIPQLWNVLISEMSIVGPRPEVPKYVNLYNSHQLSILNVLPGITDIASILLANENEILEQKKNPESYYETFLLPFKIRISKVYAQKPTIEKYLVIIFWTFKKLIGLRIKRIKKLEHFINDFGSSKLLKTNFTQEIPEGKSMKRIEQAIN